LREYQFNGVLADDMGLGKTVQTLAHLLVEKRSGRLKQPALIIAPTSLMGNWRRETEHFAPELRVLTLHGDDRHARFGEIESNDLVLTTYPLLVRDTDILLAQHYHYVVLDEAQAIKNPATKMAKTVRNLKSNHRLCLTGTPLENHLGEIWSLFDFLMPGFLGNLQTFNRCYRVPIEKQGNVERSNGLAKRIQPFLLRREKSEVASELPPKTEIVHHVELSKEQAQLYESIRVAMDKRVSDAIKRQGLSRSHITILDALLKLRQVCCDPRLVKLERAKKVKCSAKLEWLMEMLPKQLEEGRRILLFSQFTSMLSLIETELKQRGIDYSKLTGQTRKRDDAIQRFREGEVSVFLISLKAGGTGLNLVEADTVIIYDPWWNPAVEAQAIDRAHRIGQDKPVFIYKLVTSNSVEEKMLAMQDKKRALARGIYSKNSDEGMALLNEDSLKELFAPLS
jgi:SNF2 family DNA or RNA helicase